MSALHKRSRRCVIKGCDKTGFQDLTEHFAECHRPWFLEPNKCCFQCEVAQDNEGHLWQDHFLQSCGALDDEKTQLWVFYMNGLLVDLCWALQLQDIGALLQLVTSQDYFKMNMEPLTTIQAALCRTWCVCNRVPVPEVHRQPVDQLGILVHPTVIQNIMEVVSVRELEIILANSPVSRTLDGKAAVVLDPNVSYFPLPKFVDAHFHPEKVMKDFEASDWKQVVKKCQPKATKACRPQNLLACLAFPKAYHLLEDASFLQQSGLFLQLGLHPTMVAQKNWKSCLLYTSPSPRDGLLSRMPSSA